MFQYCKNHLEINEVLTKRKFFFVKENEICRDRPNTMMKTMSNTRQVHQICNLSKSQKCLMVRELSCFCKLCEAEKDEECLNREYIKPYELKQLQFEDKARKTKHIPKCDPTVSDNIEENSQMKDAFENTGKKESSNLCSETFLFQHFSLKIKSASSTICAKSWNSRWMKMAKIGLPKGSGKRLKVREKSVKSQGILKWILSGNPDLPSSCRMLSRFICSYILLQEGGISLKM